MDGFGKNYYIEHRNDGRKYVRCRNRNLSGLKCSFCKRYDHFKNWFNANNTHVCHYSEIENNLDNLFQKEISKDISIEKIYKEIAVLIGRENLPLNFCSSNSLSSLIKLSILYGSKIIAKSTIQISTKYIIHLHERKYEICLLNPHMKFIDLL